MRNFEMFSQIEGQNYVFFDMSRVTHNRNESKSNAFSLFLPVLMVQKNKKLRSS